MRADRPVRARLPAFVAVLLVSLAATCGTAVGTTPSATSWAGPVAPGAVDGATVSEETVAAVSEETVAAVSEETVAAVSEETVASLARAVSGAGLGRQVAGNRVVVAVVGADGTERFVASFDDRGSFLAVDRGGTGDGLLVTTRERTALSIVASPDPGAALLAAYDHGLVRLEGTTPGTRLELLVADVAVEVGSVVAPRSTVDASVDGDGDGVPESVVVVEPALTPTGTVAGTTVATLTDTDGDGELDAAHGRSSERLRHRDRAVTIWDYERLVLVLGPEPAQAPNGTRLRTRVVDRNGDGRLDERDRLETVVVRETPDGLAIVDDVAGSGPQRVDLDGDGTNETVVAASGTPGNVSVTAASDIDGDGSADVGTRTARSDTDGDGAHDRESVASLDDPDGDGALEVREESDRSLAPTVTAVSGIDRDGDDRPEAVVTLHATDRDRDGFFEDRRRLVYRLDDDGAVIAATERSEQASTSVLDRFLASALFIPALAGLLGVGCLVATGAVWYQRLRRRPESVATRWR